jgi:hypothetical protein
MRFFPTVAAVTAFFLANGAWADGRVSTAPPDPSPAAAPPAPSLPPIGATVGSPEGDEANGAPSPGGCGSHHHRSNEAGDEDPPRDQADASPEGSGGYPGGHAHAHGCRPTGAYGSVDAGAGQSEGDWGHGH